MKKIAAICLVLFTCYSYADEWEDELNNDLNWLPPEQYDELQAFSLLPAEQQLNEILEKTKYLGMDYIRHREIFLKNPEAKSLLFNRFETAELAQGNFQHSILWNILSDRLLFDTRLTKNKLTRDEELRLADIFEKHLSHYLRTYKKFDTLCMRIEHLINIIRYDENIAASPGYGLRIYEKYIKKGYKDLIYEFDEEMFSSVNN
jgi:hypothetical protein